MTDPIDPHAGRPAPAESAHREPAGGRPTAGEPVQSQPAPGPPTAAVPAAGGPGDRPSVGDLLRRHPELAPPPVAAVAKPFPRWKTFVNFTFLLLVALGGAALAANVAAGAAIVGSGLGGTRVTLTGVTDGLRNSAATVVAPPSLAGRSVSVVGGSQDGTYYLWPGHSSVAYPRGWSFLLGEWLPLLLVLLCVIAVGVIVKVLVKTLRHQPV